jgi:glucose-1-phosphate thymidylyltransferase
VDIDDGSISCILEKPNEPPTDLAYVGVIVFTPTVFEYIERIRPSWRGELELTQALNDMATGDATISWNVVGGVWKDVGTPIDVIETNRLLQEDLEHEIQGEISPEADITEPVSLGEGSVVSESANINGPVVIGKDTTIGPNAQIGPYTSIGDGCTVEGSRVSSSVVMNRAEIRGDREIENSIIGVGAIINSSAGDGPTQYVIGLDSVIDGEI